MPHSLILPNSMDFEINIQSKITLTSSYILHISILSYSVLVFNCSITETGHATFYDITWYMIVFECYSIVKCRGVVTLHIASC